jgi:hypothetical protein
MVLSIKRHRTANPQASQQGVRIRVWRILNPQAVGLQEGTRGSAELDEGFRLTKKSCSVLITTVFSAKQIGSLARNTFRDRVKVKIHLT